MRLALDPRARRLLRRVPRTNAYTLLELALLSLLAIQCARLIWTIVTPVGPIGDWRPAQPSAPPGALGLLGSFDPFFRLSGTGGPVVVTSLSLKLYGVRQDQASGRGSAIIAAPDGTQRSFAVGEEIVPGVTLTAVDFDSVTISHGGTSEQLFMDQSPEAGVAGGAPALPPPPVGVVTPATTAQAPGAATPSLAADIRFQPRMNGGKISGIVVQPQGSGDGFRAAGFAPGDVIIAVNGRRILSPDQLGQISAELAAGAASVQVERAGRVMRLQPGSRR